MSEQQNKSEAPRLCSGGFTSKKQVEKTLGKGGLLTEELPAGGLTQESFDGPEPAESGEELKEEESDE